jgi:hypothetical protein
MTQMDADERHENYKKLFNLKLKIYILFLSLFICVHLRHLRITLFFLICVNLCNLWMILFISTGRP